MGYLKRSILRTTLYILCTSPLGRFLKGLFQLGFNLLDQLKGRGREFEFTTTHNKRIWFISRPIALWGQKRPFRMTTQEDWLDCVCVCLCVVVLVVVDRSETKHWILRFWSAWCFLGQRSKYGGNQLSQATKVNLAKNEFETPQNNYAMQKHRTILGVVKNLPPTNGPSKQKW